MKNTAIEHNWKIEGKNIEEGVVMNENLRLDTNKLKQEVSAFVQRLVSDGVLSSFHREKTSGDMNPQDFTEDLTHKLLSAIEEWIQLVNNRGNQENDEGGMIKEDANWNGWVQSMVSTVEDALIDQGLDSVDQYEAYYIIKTDFRSESTD